MLHNFFPLFLREVGMEWIFKQNWKIVASAETLLHDRLAIAAMQFRVNHPFEIVFVTMIITIGSLLLLCKWVLCGKRRRPGFLVQALGGDGGGRTGGMPGGGGSAGRSEGASPAARLPRLLGDEECGVLRKKRHGGGPVE